MAVHSGLVQISFSNSHGTFSSSTGTKYHKSEPVYPTQNKDWEAVFPDGTPVKKDKKPNYVFVWKTWGEWSCRLFSNASELCLIWGSKSFLWQRLWPEIWPRDYVWASSYDHILSLHLPSFIRKICVSQGEYKFFIIFLNYFLKSVIKNWKHNYYASCLFWCPNFIVLVKWQTYSYFFYHLSIIYSC